jgi:hypothetical protein
MYWYLPEGMLFYNHAGGALGDIASLRYTNTLVLMTITVSLAGWR